MLKARWMMLFTTGMLISSALHADDATTSSVDSKTLPAVTNRWQLSNPIEAPDYSSGWARPIANFEFQDPSALGRVSKLRGLSIFTLAEYGESRLFLGVNERGLVGLHFRALPRHGDERHLELVRMPYLKPVQSDVDED